MMDCESASRISSDTSFVFTIPVRTVFPPSVAVIPEPVRSKLTDLFDGLREFLRIGLNAHAHESVLGWQDLDPLPEMEIVEKLLQVIAIHAVCRDDLAENSFDRRYGSIGDGRVIVS